MYKQMYTLGNGQRILISTNPDIYLYNGESHSQLIYSGSETSPDNWEEVTKEECESMLEQSENDVVGQ